MTFCLFEIYQHSIVYIYSFRFIFFIVLLFKQHMFSFNGKLVIFLSDVKANYHVNNFYYSIMYN